MYKATKTAAHWIGKAKCGTYGIRFFWPLINTYGEEERSARLVNTIIRKVLHGETPDLSAGNQYYDFELVKSFDDIVSKGTFMGLQPGKKTVHGMEYEVNPGLGLGSEPGVEVFKEIIEFYHQLHFVTGNGGQNIKTIVDYPRSDKTGQRENVHRRADKRMCGCFCEHGLSV